MTRQELLAENQNLKAELALSKSEIDTFKKRISALELKFEPMKWLIKTLEKIKEHDQESLDLLLPSAKDHKESNQ